jgi:Flp pilus assembly protein TadD
VRFSLDRRLVAAVATVAAIVAGGAMLQGAPSEGAAPAARADALAHLSAAERGEFDTGFRQATVMLHARRYDHALTALHRLLELAPEVPEVHVNAGFALMGLKRPEAARDFFTGAIALSPNLPNAYYGLAMALDATGDRPGARGAMRTFIHLSMPDDPWLPKARAALWEWQSGP